VPLLVITLHDSYKYALKTYISECPVTSPESFWAHCVYGWQTDAKRILSTLPPEDWRRPWGCPRVTWLSTIQRIWDPTISNCLKQWIWPRTGLCGGCGWRTALRNLELHVRNDNDDVSNVVFLVIEKCGDVHKLVVVLPSFVFVLADCRKISILDSSNCLNLWIWHLYLSNFSTVQNTTVAAALSSAPCNMAEQLTYTGPIIS